MSEEHKEDNEYWEINRLETDILVLEDIFGSHIGGHKSGVTFDDIQIRAYAHAIIVFKEIICLLRNGFPDGALARARRLYEQLIIYNYLNSQKEKPKFNDLITRYCDSQNINAYINLISLYDFFQDTAKKQEAKQKLSVYKNKYKRYKKHTQNRAYLPDYWWTGDSRYDSFNKLQNLYNEPFAKIMYKRACISSHAGAMGDFALLGRPDLDDHIYTGATFYGFSIPLLLATLAFYETTNMVFINLGIEFPEKEHTDLYELIKYYQNTFFEDKLPKDELYN